MIKSFLKISSADYKILVNQFNIPKQFHLNNAEYEKKKDLKLILEQLYNFTYIIQCDGVTISKLYPVLSTIKHNYNTLTENKKLKQLNCLIRKLNESKFIKRMKYLLSY